MVYIMLGLGAPIDIDEDLLQDIVPVCRFRAGCLQYNIQYLKIIREYIFSQSNN